MNKHQAIEEGRREQEHRDAQEKYSASVKAQAETQAALLTRIAQAVERCADALEKAAGPKA